MKLNIGGNAQRINGFINIDGLDIEGVDAVCELDRAPYYLKIKPDKLSLFAGGIKEAKIEGEQESLYMVQSDSVEEIVAIEFLEHISFHQTINILREWYRILKFDGKIRIQVPDCGKAMEYYVNNEICTCVPHKGTPEQMVADGACFICGGKAKINPTRWLYSFTGAQKHKYDAHLNIFTKDRLEEALIKAGFDDIRFEDDLIKLKVTARK